MVQVTLVALIVIPIALLIAMIAGVVHWRRVWGKVVTIGAGILLLALGTYVAILALVVGQLMIGDQL